MQDLYNTCYEAFVLFINKVLDTYDNNIKAVTVITVDVLTNKNSVFRNELEMYLDGVHVDIDTCSKVLKFILVSKAYIVNYYDFVHEINVSCCEEALFELESLSKEDIVDLFYKPTSTTDYVIEDFLSYISRPYTFWSKAKELIVKDDKLAELLALNPFEALDIGDYIPEEKFIQSEKYIQTFFDLYDKSISDLDEDDYNEVESAELGYFAQNIYEYFNYDVAKVAQFICYIISNVYEFLVIEKSSNYSDFELYFNLIEYIENTDENTLCSEFLNNSEFAIKVIDLFLEENSFLYEGDLLDKRDVFKKCGNIQVLKRLNPYYDAEEIVYNQLKETSRLN